MARATKPEETSKAVREYAKDLRTKLTKAETLVSRYRAELAVRVAEGFANPRRIAQALLDEQVDLLDSDAVSKWFADHGDGYARAATEPEPEERTPPGSEIQFNPEQDHFEDFLKSSGQAVWSAPTTERQDP